jgi:hypothetical protein
MKGTAGAVAQWAIVGKLLNSTVKSTAWRTASAITKSSIANALAKGDMAKATNLIRLISQGKPDSQAASQ